jgi:LacI family transcriptional regulator
VIAGNFTEPACFLGEEAHMTANEPAESSSASIVNVAAIANVSTATVSRVLSGKRTKDDDIARRVRAAAHSLNYSVNFAASALRSTVTRTIGLIVPSVQDPFSARLIDTLEPLVNQSGRQLALSVGRTPEVQKERIVLMAARHVDGLIVVPLPGIDLGDVLAQYAQEIPAVQIGGLQHTTFTSDPAPIQPALQQVADEILRLLADQSNTPVHVNLPSRLIAPGSQDAE